MASDESQVPYASDRDPECASHIDKEAHSQTRLVLYLARPIIAGHYNPTGKVDSG